MAKDELNILLIEDNPGDARLFEEYVKDLKKTRIINERTFKEGKERLSSDNIDLVILDLDLPDSASRETLNNIRFLTTDIPVIILTGLRDERSALAAIRSGAQDYLVKSEIDTGNICRAIKFAKERFNLFNSVSVLSKTDDLTGLYNRRGFYTLSAKQHEFASANGLCAHIVYIDIDNLKKINDTLGHETGDTAIRETALLLEKVFREWDVIARIGGDEFAVLVITRKSEDIESAVISRIKRYIDEYNRKEGRFRLSLSFGISSLDEFGRSALMDAIRNADELMYDNKMSKCAGA